MTIYYVNTGTRPNAGNGDSLRVAFNKINANFAYLNTTSQEYNPENITDWRGSPTVATFSQGLNELASRMVNVESLDLLNLSSGLVPNTNLAYDLGSTSSQWRSLYVGTSTIYLGGTALSVAPGGLLTVDGNALSGGSGDRLVNGDLELVLDGSGTLTTPLLLPRAFTAVLDEAHRTVGSGSYTGPAWAFHLEWQCSQNGQVELIADNGPLPSLVNGYANGQTFVFTSADHGIPDYTLTVVLSNVVQAGPAGWTANLSFSPPPAYPPTIASSGAIKLASNGNSFVLGTDGGVTFPDGATINSSEFSAAPNSRLYLYGGSAAEGSGRDVRIYGGDAGSTSTNSYDGGSVRIQGGQGVNGAPGGYVRLRTYGADNNSYSLTLDNDGVVYLPTNGIQFQDGSVQTTAYTPLPISYKGFRAHYGSMFNNTDDPNGPINKLVIYKSTVTTAASAIDTDTSSDDFQVTGLTGSDVVAMLVVVSDNITQTSLADLKTFVEAVIDHVILNGGVEGNVNSIAAMKSAFYDNFNDFNSIIPDIKTNLEFYNTDSLRYNVIDYTQIINSGTGSGWNWYGIKYNPTTSQFEMNSGSTGMPGGFAVGDTLTILGTNLQDYQSNTLASPANDIVITVATTDGNGIPQTFTTAGTVPYITGTWPVDSIQDGGDDEYDGANAIHTNLAAQIIYNDGNVVPGSSAFGGGDYVVTYQAGIFGVFATGADIDIIGTSGNNGGYGNDNGSSGFDGDGEAVTGGLYADVGGDNSIKNGQYSVSVGTNGVVTMVTSRGTVEFGALPEPGGPSHFHIMKAAGDNNDLYFGDDFNYVLQRGPGYGPTPAYGVEIGANDKDGGDQQVWRFDTDGDLTLPGGLIFDRNNTSIRVGMGFHIASGEGISLEAIDATDPNNLIYKSWSFGTDGDLTVPGDIKSTAGVGPVVIEANNGTLRTWTFGGDGSLTLPSGAGFGLGDSGQLKVNDGTTQSLDLRDTSGRGFYTNGDGYALRSNGNNTWQFGTTGTLTFPQGGTLRVGTVPAHSTGAVNDKAGTVAFANGYIYYCTADYGQTGHQVIVATLYNSQTSANTNQLQLTKTADTLQITVGDVISDSNGGPTSTVVTVSSDADYTYVGTGGFAYECVFPLTFTSSDYVAGGNIWKRVAWSGDTW